MQDVDVSNVLSSYVSIKNAIRGIHHSGILLGHVRTGFNLISNGKGDFVEEEEEEEQEETHKPVMGKLEKELCKNLSTLGYYRYYSEGDIELKPDVFLNLKNLKKKDESGEEKLVSEMKMNCRSIDVNELLPLCNQAPYGDLEKEATVVDTEVRNAFECTAESFSLEYEDGRDPLEDAKIEISNQLAHGREVQLIPHKLNIYSKGGHFNSHVDTPRDAEKMIGTFIVALPVYFEGGSLRVCKPGYNPPPDSNRYYGDSNMHYIDMKSVEIETIYPQSSRYGFFGGYSYGASTQKAEPTRTEKKKLCWAAIYGDCVHLVDKVSEGFRVTLTYDIHLTGKYLVEFKPSILQKSSDEMDVHSLTTAPKIKTSSDLDQDLPPTENFIESSEKNLDENNQLFDRVIHVIDTLDFPAIGILLGHRYTQPSLEQFQLKGADQLLVSRLRNSNLCKEENSKYICKLLPVIVKVNRASTMESEYDKFHEIKQAVYSMRSEDLDYLTNRTSKRPLHPLKQKIEEESADKEKSESQAEEAKEQHQEKEEEEDEEEEDNDDLMGFYDSNRKVNYEIGFPVPFYRFGIRYGNRIDHSCQGYIEYTGNEAQPYESRSTYFGAALILQKKSI